MENAIFPTEWQQLLDEVSKPAAPVASNDRMFNNIMGLVVTAGTILSMIALAPAVDSFARYKATPTTQLERDIERAKVDVQAENYNDFVRSAAKARIILDK